MFDRCTENNGHHGDLDMRQSSSSWLYSEVIDKAQSTVYTYKKSGTLTGLTTQEFFAYAKKFAPDIAWWGIEGSTEKHLLTNPERTILISVECYKKGRSTEKASLRIATIDQSTIQHFIQWSKKHITITEGNTVYCIGQGSSGLHLQDIGKIQDQLARSNYNNEILDKADYVIEQINSTNPQGRLVIINGQAGTGKTHLIKGIIPRIQNALIILLPTRLISEVDGPALVSLLAGWKDDYGYDVSSGNNSNPAIVLILEDADDCLTTRNAANMSTVSSVLNHTDGIFGSMLDLRLIATTNADHIEFDQAFTRPGRLCTHITINKLSAEHATRVYEIITGGKKKEYTAPITLAEVYADANDNPYGFIKEETSVGFKV